MTEEELYTVYKGVYLPKLLHPPESIAYYEQFTFRPDDVVIVTYPKSGKFLPSMAIWKNGVSTTRVMDWCLPLKPACVLRKGRNSGEAKFKFRCKVSFIYINTQGTYSLGCSAVRQPNSIHEFSKHLSKLESWKKYLSMNMKYLKYNSKIFQFYEIRHTNISDLSYSISDTFVSFLAP